MKNKVKTFFSKNILISQLMQIYSLLLIVVISIMVLGYSMLVIKKTQDDAHSTVDNMSQQIASSVQTNDSVLSNVVWNLATTQNHFENMRNYMSLPPQEYFEYSLKNWQQGDNNELFPDILSSIFYSFPTISTIDIYLDEVNRYLHVDREKTNGIFEYGKPVVTDELTLIRSIQIPNTMETVGQINVTFDNSVMLNDLNHGFPASALMFDSNRRLLYSKDGYMNQKELTEITNTYRNSGILPLKAIEKKFIVRHHVIKGITILVLIDKSEVHRDIIRQLLPVFFVGILVTIILLIGLEKIFRSYSKQVAVIVDVTEEVSQGNLVAQIDTSDMRMELYDLSMAINQMIQSLNQYIEDVYTLEVKQRDAHMRALQSQINPHFMYNTLEYIRMYAISQGQDELADVVFAFSSLLRNNINQAKTISLEDELKFCEKYVYLYQMRYPDSIAYHFEVDESLENFTVPKFMIQPLIENYFIHGMDHGRGDNAISVKAKRVKNQIQIMIKDNGKGIDEGRLQDIKKSLEDSKVGLGESVGVNNVYERIKSYFGEQAMFVIESDGSSGTIITITIFQEEENE